MRLTFRMVATLLALLTGGCGGREQEVNPGELRSELEGIYTTVRSAFEQYDLEAARPYVDDPADGPAPSRQEAQAMAEFLPRIEECRFLDLVTKGDRAAYYMESGLDDASASEVTVIRFVRGESGWRLAPAPHTLSSYGTDVTDEAGLRRLIGEQEMLAPFPEGSGGEAPVTAESGPSREEGDPRSAAEIARDLEVLWGRLRAALLAGDVESAMQDLLLTEGQEVPTAEAAKRFGKGLPDLTKCSFLKLGWRRDKPRVCAYYADAEPESPERSKIAMIVFSYDRGRWWFVPGPTSLEEVPLPKTDREGLLREIGRNPDLGL